MTDTGGAAAGGALITLTPCSEGLGPVGEGTAGSDGAYLVEATLPPRDAFIVPDSAFPYEVECSVFVDQNESIEAITLPFYRDRDDVVPVEVDLVVN